MMYNSFIIIDFLAAFFMILAGAVVFVSSLGFLFFKNYFSRLHMISLATNFAVFLIVCATIFHFGWSHPLLILKLSLLFIFVFLTGPINILLAGFLGWERRDKIKKTF